MNFSQAMIEDILELDNLYKDCLDNLTGANIICFSILKDSVFNGIQLETLDEGIVKVCIQQLTSIMNFIRSVGITDSGFFEIYIEFFEMILKH